MFFQQQLDRLWWPFRVRFLRRTLRFSAVRLCGTIFNSPDHIYEKVFSRKLQHEQLHGPTEELRSMSDSPNSTARQKNFVLRHRFQDDWQPTTNNPATTNIAPPQPPYHRVYDDLFEDGTSLYLHTHFRLSPAEKLDARRGPSPANRRPGGRREAILLFPVKTAREKRQRQLIIRANHERRRAFLESSKTRAESSFLASRQLSRMSKSEETEQDPGVRARISSKQSFLVEFRDETTKNTTRKTLAPLTESELLVLQLKQERFCRRAAELFRRRGGGDDDPKTVVDRNLKTGKISLLVPHSEKLGIGETTRDENDAPPISSLQHQPENGHQPEDGGHQPEDDHQPEDGGQMLLRDESSSPSDASTAFPQAIRRIFQKLVRRNPADAESADSSFLPLPHEPFAVPGGRFREIYYWDTYWTCLGYDLNFLSDIVVH